MDKEERKKYAQLDKELTMLSQKMNAIVARHKKDIWTDKTYDKDRKDVLRNAELTLRLDSDEECKSLLHQSWDLEVQLRELGEPFEL